MMFDNSWEEEDEDEDGDDTEESDLENDWKDIQCDLFHQGMGVDTALHLALESHPKQHYKCILPVV